MSDMSDQFVLVPRSDLEHIKTTMQEVLAELKGSKIEPRPEWMSIAEAARHLGCSPDTVRRRINNGELEAKGRGKLRRVKVSD